MKKIALVTGGSRGLGKVLAQLLVKNNYQVIATYNSLVCSDKIIDYQKCDLADECDINNLFKYINDKYGSLDVLVNNAALCLDNDFRQKVQDEFLQVLKVNLVGTFLMCKEAIKVMNKGVIVNIASLDGIDTFSPYSMDYAASKAGVINITKNMASDVSNARIVALAPAWINTQTVLDMNPNYLKEEMKKHHQDKLLDKEKVALKIIDMIENDKYKTGSIIRMEDDSNE